MERGATNAYVSTVHPCHPPHRTNQRTNERTSALRSRLYHRPVPIPHRAALRYDTSKQLNNHTDQSLYGLPGILLGFHVAFGEGNNSLTDGFAVAYTMKERHPEHFKMLSKYGMNAGRHLGYYDGAPLCFDTTHPVSERRVSISV